MTFASLFALLCVALSRFRRPAPSRETVALARTLFKVNPNG